MNIVQHRRAETADVLEERLNGLLGRTRLPHLIELAKLLEHENLARRLDLLAEADKLMEGEGPSDVRVQVRIWRLRGAISVRDLGHVPALLTRAQEDVYLLNQPLWRAKLDNIRAMIAHHKPDPAQARQHLEQAAVGFREAGDREGEVRVRHNLSHVLFRLGLTEETLTECKRVVALTQHTQDLSLRGLALSALGSAYLEVGRVPEALTEMLRALEIQEQAKLHRQAILTRQNLAAAWQQVGDLDQASQYLRAALTDAHQHAQPQLEPELWCALSQLLRAANEAQEAERITRHALTSVNEGGPVLTASLKQELAWCVLAQDRPDEALELVNLHAVQKHAQLLSEGRLLTARALVAKSQGSQAMAVLQEMRAELPQRAIGLGIQATLTASECALSSGSLVQARTLADQAITAAIASGKSDLRIQGLLLRAQSQAASQDFEAAYATFHSLRELEQQVDRDRQRQHVSAMNAVYQVERAQQEAMSERLRNVELESTNQELRRLARARNDTLGIVAHDLRNPLAGILLSGELIQELLSGTETFSVERSVELARNIETAAMAMAEDIEALLTTQVVVNQHIEATPGGASVQAAVADAVQTLRKRAVEKQIFIVEIGLTNLRVGVEQRALREVLDNLLSNALKFSQSGTTVRIRAIRADGLVHLSVSDQGPGLSEKDLASMYQRFGRLSAQPTAGERSTGLGLYVVKCLVDAMGAQIHCQSTLGQGTAFTVVMPEV